MTAQAAPVRYIFALTVDSFLPDDPPQSCGIDPENSHFGCDWKPGDEIFGRFELFDDTSSLADGIYSDIPLRAWRIRIGEVLWDMNVPSDFVGFRDGAYCGADGTGLDGINPGLIITAGQVSGFCGGVYGDADAAFIDFDYVAGPGRFGAGDFGNNFLAGTYSIYRRVPEPALLALLSFGFGLCGLVVNRRYQAGSSRLGVTPVIGKFDEVS
jgi:hypothetical protein